MIFLMMSISRNKDFKDPPFDPPKLFRVERIKSLKGLPYWEKDILTQFRLDGQVSDNIYLFTII